MIEKETVKEIVEAAKVTKPMFAQAPTTKASLFVKAPTMEDARAKRTNANGSCYTYATSSWKVTRYADPGLITDKITRDYRHILQINLIRI